MWRRFAQRLCLPLMAIAVVLGVPGGTSAADDALVPAVPEAQAVEEGFVPPQIILESHRSPVYPPAAKAARYTGSVVIELTVLRDGAVGQPRVVHCTRTNVGFEAAALDAVKHWRFVPATDRGEPVEVSTRFQLNFTGSGQKARMFVAAGMVGLSDWKKAGDDGQKASGSSSPSRSGDRK